MSVQRIDQLRKSMAAENLDGLIVSDLNKIRYLTGYTGSSGLLFISGKKADSYTDSRYTVQAKKQVKGARVHIARTALNQEMAKLPGIQTRNLLYGIDGEAMTVAERVRLQALLPQAQLIPSEHLTVELGWVKEKSEIDLIKKAVTISDIAFERILNLVRPGIRERELAAELEYQMLMLGSERPAFESIVASGYRSAMPHGVASSKKLKKGDFVTFDFGATVDGYVSDITRTVVVGKATSRQKKIYDIVARSQKAGIRKVKAGVAGVAVDAACRDIIKKAGYGKNFGHGTGHGIGFLVHTGPRVSPLSKDKLRPNNVITIEPGIYVDGWGGVRIEDDVVVTRSGGTVLNKAEKKLLEL